MVVTLKKQKQIYQSLFVNIIRITFALVNFINNKIQIYIDID